MGGAGPTSEGMWGERGSASTLLIRLGAPAGVAHNGECLMLFGFRFNRCTHKTPKRACICVCVCVHGLGPLYPCLPFVHPG